MVTVRPIPVALLSAALFCPAALATADLTVDGAASTVVAPGGGIDWSITGTPGATTYLLLDLSPGPVTAFGHDFGVGFSPLLQVINLGAMPGGGSLDFNTAVPGDAALDGLALYADAAVADGAVTADWSFAGGVVVTIANRGEELAGRPLGANPHFEYVRAINEGQPVFCGVADALHPGLSGSADVYIVDAKTAGQWDADPSLVDVSGDGANSIVFLGATMTSVQIDAGTLSGDAGTGLGVGYDVVVDMNQDGQLDDGDLIDGYGDEAGVYIVHDTTAPGPLAVTEALYSGGSFLGQNLYYPTNIGSMGELPLVVISHGNGHNYQWYDHIGYHLASYGFIVMSHQNNTVPGVNSAAVTTRTNTDYFLGNLDIIQGGALDGHVDDQSIVWIGHSRGGEGITIAYDDVFEGTQVPAEFTADDIVLLSSIAPTAFNGPANSNPHSTNFHLWVGQADADVSGCPFSNAAQPFHLHDRALQTRLALSLHGVGHGDFHDGGGSSVASGPCLVGRAQTHQIMRGYILPLVQRFVNGNVPALDFLWRDWNNFKPIGAPTSSCVVADLTYRPGSEDVEKFVIDDYQTNTGLALSSSGSPISAVGILNATEGVFDDDDTQLVHDGTPFNGMTYGRSTDETRGMVFGFNNDASLVYDLLPQFRNASTREWLSMRVCQVTRDPNTVADLSTLSFTVALTDNAGNTASLPVDVWGGGVEEPYDRGGCGSGVGWQNSFETVRIRLTDFLHAGSGLDLSDLDTVSLHFGPSNGSNVGRLGIDDLEFQGAH